MVVLHLPILRLRTGRNSKSCFKFLKNGLSCLGSLNSSEHNWRWKSSKPIEVNQKQEEYALDVNPNATTFLKETRIEKKNSKEGLSLWDHIQTYRCGAYHEKTFLIDPKVGETIGAAIEKNSDRGPETKFIDADGGLCLVSDDVMKRNLFQGDQSHFVFEKDINFRVLNNRASKDYLSKDCKICKISFVKSVTDYHSTWGHYLDPLYKEMSAFPSTSWDNQHPNYTLFGTVTHGLLKYLTMRCLYRNESQFCEFSLGRPEFFFVVSPRTWTHLSVESGAHILHRNILFGIVFDFELVAELPRESFLPWKKSPGKIRSKITQRYHNLEGTFFLIKVRPKKDIGLVEGTPIHYLTYFVQTMYQNNSNQRLVPMVERWLPGAGLDYVRNGYSVYTISRDVTAEEVVPLLNILVKQKNFNNVNNNFVIQANSSFQSQFRDAELISTESKEFYASLKRDLCSSKESSGASGKKRKINPLFRNS